MQLKFKTSFFFSLPAIALYSVLVLIPIVYGFYLSLTNWDGFSTHIKIIGWANYAGLFDNDEFWGSFKVTIYFTLLFSVVQNVVALALALVLDLPFRKWVSSTARVLVFLPTILTPVIVGYIWYYLLKMGLPSIFDALGMHAMSKIEWIGSPLWSIYSVIFVSVWLHLGVAMLIYVNAIGGISDEVHQAALLDGAVRLKKVVYIYLPLMLPALVINIILAIINGFKQFDQVFVMTNGGPGTSTETVSLLIYKFAFVSNHVGQASAVAYVLLAVVMIISMFILRTFRDREVEA